MYTIKCNSQNTDDDGARMAKSSECVYVVPQSWKQICSIIVWVSLTMSCFRLLSMWLLWHALSMFVMSSLVGMLVYMLTVSGDASLSFRLYGISLRPLVRWVVFFTLYVYDKGMYVCSFLVSVLAILYAGAFVQLITGLMG
jgi:uncharacterized SAM-binding protein YcdF (DUF218 family)